MKKIFFAIIAFASVTASCSKNDNPDPGNGAVSFEAEINGVKTPFDIVSATLLKSESFGEKRLDIAALSVDKNTKLQITVAQSPEHGNGMDIKDYIVRFGTDDNPATPDIDESFPSFEGLITYGYKAGQNYIFEMHRQNGIIKLQSCNISDQYVSGIFSGTVNNLSGDNVVLTNGKFNNVNYSILTQ